MSDDWYKGQIVSVPERGFVALIRGPGAGVIPSPGHMCFSPRAGIRGFDRLHRHCGSGSPTSFSPRAGIRGFDTTYLTLTYLQVSRVDAVSVPERGFVALIAAPGTSGGLCRETIRFSPRAGIRGFDRSFVLIAALLFAVFAPVSVPERGFVALIAPGECAAST